MENNFKSKCREIVIRYEKDHGNKSLIYNSDIKIIGQRKKDNNIHVVLTTDYNRFYHIVYNNNYSRYEMKVYSLSDSALYCDN